MRKTSLFTLLLVALVTACSRQGDVFVADSVNELRAPAYPLVTIDPFTSAWSFTDKLNESPVRHWTGKAHPMVGALKVDGKVYRFMGVEDAPLDFIIPSALTQRWSARFTEEQPKGDWSVRLQRRSVERGQGSLRYPRPVGNLHRVDKRGHLGASRG